MSPLAPLGVKAALAAAKDPSIIPKPKIFDEFALTDRVAVVTGANGGIGLEMALALCELGARAVYCLDLSPTPSESWTTTRDYVEKMNINSRLEYVSVDVTDQQRVWKAVEEIGDKEGRMDACVAAAGILKPNIDCLEYPAETFRQVSLLSFDVWRTRLTIHSLRLWMSTPTACSSQHRRSVAR